MAERPRHFPRPDWGLRSPESTRRRQAAEARSRRYRDVEIVPGLTLVETLTVSAPVRKQYSRLICSLMSYITGWTPDPTPMTPPLSLSESLEYLDKIGPDETVQLLRDAQACLD